jgi:signal transduction histidine kinase/ActR/RegA family two-component response regulator
MDEGAGRALVLLAWWALAAIIVALVWAVVRRGARAEALAAPQPAVVLPAASIVTTTPAQGLNSAGHPDDLLRTISHELRTPLNAILGWAQVLEPRADLPEDVTHAIHVIQRNALRQRQLLDDLVDVSRVISGDIRLDRRAVDLRTALDEACDAIRPAARARGVTVDCEQAETAVVHADARRVQQALSNLLANAVRFTPAGGAITVGVVCRGGEALVSVRDTGVGIDPTFLPHVFEPFRQQPGAVAHEGASFGLGLALVRAIVTAHEGRVTAESDGPGRGACFTMHLPLARAPAEPERVAHSAAHAASPSAPLDGVRVLAIDDEPDWRELLERILTTAGADTRVAGSAAQGLEILAEWRPDVILSDIAMPGADGYGLLATIRSLADDVRSVPALAMTAHASADERVRTALAGFAAHLAKPIAPQELVDAVARTVQEERHRRERRPDAG